MTTPSREGTAMPRVWLPADVSGIGERSLLTTPGNFSIERFRHKSYSLEGIAPSQSHIVALRLKGQCFAERLSEGRRSTAMTGPDSITIIPAQHESNWRVCGEGELTYFHFQESMLRSIADQEYSSDRRKADIVPRLGIHDPQLAAVARTIVREVEENGSRCTLFLDSLMMQLTTWLVRRQTAFAASPRVGDRRIEPFNRTMARRLIEYIDAHLARDLSLAELSSLANLSASHFSHRFKATFGVPPHRMVLNMRIEKAKALVKRTDFTLVETALAVGFSDQAHFITTFRKAVGETPGAFRARM